MAITDENTVLILGAGVSAPFGLQLGGDLIGEIAKQLNSEMERACQGNWKTALRIDEESVWKATNNYVQSVRYAAGDYDNEDPISETYSPTNDFRMLGAILKGLRPTDTEDISDRLKEVRDLVEFLDEQTSETIDDFIAQNPKFSKITKKCIATLLFHKCYTRKEKTYHLHTVAKRFVSKSSDDSLDNNSTNETKNNSERNWIHLLINLVRQGVTEGKVTEDNKVRIITFNYDQILEYVLEQQFNNTQVLKGQDYKNYIEIIHFHGQCKPLKKETSTPVQDCCEWAEGIHVVNEVSVTEAMKNGRSKAKSWVESATEIYACGFAFAGPNCEQLGLVAEDKVREISYCNYDGNTGLKKMMVRKYAKEKLGQGYSSDRIIPLTKIEVAEGTIDKPLGVTDWFRAGYAGVMPG